MGVTAAAVRVLVLANDEYGRWISAFLEGVESRDVRQMCLSDPKRFQLRLDDATQVATFDARTFEPDQSIGRQWPIEEIHDGVRGRHVGFHLRFFSDPGRMIFMKLADGGPCSLFVGARPRDMRVRLGTVFLLALELVPPVALMTALATILVLRPLLRRIRILKERAGDAGDASYRRIEESSRDELSLVAGALNHAHDQAMRNKQELRARATALERHLANVAHDLRTPLMGLQLHLHSAFQLATVKPEEVPDILRVSLRETVYISGLTEDLWALAQLEDGGASSDASNTTVVDLSSVVRQVIARYRPIARCEKIHLEYAHPDEPVCVNGSPLLIQRLLGNLVENAIRHVPDGGHVSVVLETTEPSRFALRVIDDGPGVEPRLLSRLGERSFRTDHGSAVHTTGGGVGLSLVREICARLDWGVSFRGGEKGGLDIAVEGRAVGGRPDRSRPEQTP